MATSMKSDSIFNIRPHVLCRSTEQEGRTAFSHHELNVGDEYGEHCLPYNFILFVLSGEIAVCCNEFEGCKFKSDEMALLLRSSMVRVKAIRKTSMVVFYFDMLISACERDVFRTFLSDAEKANYDFSPVHIPAPLKVFLKQLIYFRELHVDCMHFNELKHCEFFILLRRFCSRGEIIALLAPLIAISQNFRARVLDKYCKLETGRVSEMARLVGMGRKNFDKRFREEFATSPAKWMRQEMAKKIRLFLMEPDITIADVIQKFHFSSPSHFNRFAREKFGKSPGEIIKEAKNRRSTVF
ncbi:MAG: helix-turn-helix transcriptional regulator [Tannerella sp.]|jgi:AraC-like DNA-binding protein|nr:helix-turn-helix transcriptional regulator [Tannerella sp.]